MWTSQHTCSILGVQVTRSVSLWDLGAGALQLPVFCGTQQEPPALHLCLSALHPVMDKVEWRWHRAVDSQGVGRSWHWAGMSAGHPALTGLGSKNREEFLSFAKFSVAVFSSSPINSCLDQEWL